MKNFIPLSTILAKIPKSLFQEGNESDFYDWMLDGLMLLPNTVYYDRKIELFEILDGKIELPRSLKTINNVYWQESRPTEDCVNELLSSCESEPSDLNPDICKPAITYKMWLDSPLFKQNFKLLKYQGTNSTLIKNTCGCYSSTCRESFVVTPEKIMYLTINDGFVCIDYDTPLCDENDELLIPDVQILHEYLINFAIAKHWEDRQFTKEEQASGLYQQYNQKQALLFKQARGYLMMADYNVANIIDINAGQFNKLLKLPQTLYYAR